MKKILGGLCASITISSAAFGCDLCAVYNAPGAPELLASEFRLAIAEQFSYYGTIRNEGHYVANPAQEHLASSITQLGLTYGLEDGWAVQVTMPLIARKFRRLEGGEATRGSLTGIGDTTLLVRALPLRFHREDFRARLAISAGIKLPTGDSDRLDETHAEHDEVVLAPESHDEDMLGEEHDDHHSALLLRPRHGDEEEVEESSAIHNHDLALGSGSVDFPIVVHGGAWWNQVGVETELAYTFRTEGDAQYRYGDDFTWSLRPGYVFAFGDASTLLAAVAVNGEIKAKDTQRGVKDRDTRINTVYVGPEFAVTLRQRLHAVLGVDFPVSLDNSGTQAMADYRLRAAVSIKL